MKYVLFVCTHNAGRSQMAQAFFERELPARRARRVRRLRPAREVWPEVVEVMREVGIDLVGPQAEAAPVEMQLHADWAVTMGCGDVCPYVPTMVEEWDIPDPAGRPLDEVREIRDIDRRARPRPSSSAGSTRSEATAPRTSGGCEAAADADRGVRRHPRSPEEIRACADAILDRYDDVPVRSHILTLAHKRSPRLPAPRALRRPLDTPMADR